jgi:hypothetical protein
MRASPEAPFNRALGAALSGAWSAARNAEESIDHPLLK